MELQILNPNTRNRAHSRSGWTLTEMVVAVAISTMVLAGAVTFYGFSMTSFASMTNYADLNNQSRNGSDLISRDIRAASSVASATTNQLVLNAMDGTNVSYTYDPAGFTLTRVKGGDRQTILRGITSLSFSLYQRATNSSYGYEQFPPGTAANAKLVAFQWTCSRRVAGPLNDSETLEMAKVQMRNE